MKTMRLRFTIISVMLLTALCALYVRARISPSIMSITITANGRLEHKGRPIAAIDIRAVLEAYYTTQSCLLSKSFLKIIVPGNLSSKRDVQDALQYVSITANDLQFDGVYIKWYTAHNLAPAISTPDPKLNELLQKIQ